MSDEAVPPRAAVDRLERIAAHPAMPWFVLVLALGLRLRGLGKGVWLDESFTLELSVGGTAGSVLDRLRGGDNAPLYFLLNHALARIETATRYLRLLPVACGVATVALVQRWARRDGALAGVLAGLLAATLPILLRTGDELRPYGMLALAATSALVAADRLGSPRGGTAAYVLVAGALAATVASHHLGALLVAPLALIAFARPAGERARLVPFGLAAGAGLAMLALTRPWRAAAAGSLARDWWTPPPSPEVVAAVLRTIAGPASPSWAEILEPSAMSRLTVGAAALLAAAAVAAGGRRARLLAAVALAWIAAVLAASILRLPVFWTRTIVPAVPVLVVAVAVGVATARPRPRAVLAAGVAVLALAFGARWVSGEARRPLEAWDAVAGRIRPVGAADLWIAHPGYVRSPLVHVLGEGAPRPLLQLGHRDPRAAGRVAAALAARRGRGPAAIGIVLRLDLTSMRHGTALPRVLDAVARERGRRAVRVLALTALDVAITPELLDHRRETLALLERSLGTPVAVEDRGWLVELRFAPPPHAAPEDPGRRR